MIMHKHDLTYYFKEESVTLEYNMQYISFNCFSLQSRKKFKDFKRELSESNPNQFNTINDIYSLATRHGVRATAGRKPTITDSIAF